MSDVGVKLEITGAAELDAALAEVSSKTANKFVVRALRAGGKPIQKEAQANAPVKKGAVRRSIKVRAGKQTKTLKTIVIGSSKKWFTGPEFYAAFLEFGHRVGSRKLGGARAEVPGLHFLERAAETKRQVAVDAFTASLKKDLESFKPTGAPS